MCSYTFPISHMQDPVRKEVPEAVATCHRAGILVRMVTGDNIHTARHIARECGILTEGGLALEGPKFREMPEEQVLELLPRLQVRHNFLCCRFSAGGVQYWVIRVVVLWDSSAAGFKNRKGHDWVARVILVSQCHQTLCDILQQRHKGLLQVLMSMSGTHRRALCKLTCRLPMYKICFQPCG